MAETINEGVSWEVLEPSRQMEMVSQTLKHQILAKVTGVYGWSQVQARHNNSSSETPESQKTLDCMKRLGQDCHALVKACEPGRSLPIRHNGNSLGPVIDLDLLAERVAEEERLKKAQESSTLGYKQLS